MAGPAAAPPAALILLLLPPGCKTLAVVAAPQFHPSVEREDTQLQASHMGGSRQLSNQKGHGMIIAF